MLRRLRKACSPLSNSEALSCRVPTPLLTKLSETETTLSCTNSVGEKRSYSDSVGESKIVVENDSAAIVDSAKARYLARKGMKK